MSGLSIDDTPPDGIETVYVPEEPYEPPKDRKSTRLNSSHLVISYAVFCLKKKIAYAHSRDAGFIAIANGFVYRGNAIPALCVKFLFGDITSGRLWWAEMTEMLAAADGDPR